MGLFGKSKEDMSQDQQLQNLWKWIEHLNKNQATIIKNQNILIKNNNSFIKKDKRFTDAIVALQAKDKQHDQKDAEIEAVIQGLKNLTKTVETATTTT